MTTYVIENGQGWTHVSCIGSQILTTSYMSVDLQNLLVGGQLPSFALTDEEVAFFRVNNVTSLAFPTFGVSSAGYQSGNELLGLRCDVFCFSL